ncbi:MAG: hypothetical protein RLZZ488_2197 [Pseudomonadota bacterium]|jgi:H+/Cl- antiporter ClcA
MKHSDELKEFEGAAGEIPAVVGERMQKTESRISAELNRSRKRFFLSFVLLSVLGYFSSLSVCSQYSFGLTGFSQSVAAVLHRLPDPLCPIVCGVVFSIVPVIFLFSFLDRFQRRRLIVRYWWLPVLSTLVSCLLMYFLPQSLQHEGMHHGMRAIHGDIGWLIWWTLSAVAIPFLFAWTAKAKIVNSEGSRARQR